MFVEQGFYRLFLDRVFMVSFISQKKKNSEFTIILNEVFCEPMAYYNISIERDGCAHTLLMIYMIFTSKDMYD